jgi:hypothetical protein
VEARGLGRVPAGPIVVVGWVGGGWRGRAVWVGAALEAEVCGTGGAWSRGRDPV